MAVADKAYDIPEFVRPVRALLSVSDKTGLEAFARALHAHGVELVSTGGTAAAISAMGLKVTDVSSLTGFPEIMDGRVKTLHPAVHGGILALRVDTGHLQAMADHEIDAIDIVAVNLYPFETVAADNPPWSLAIENVDIGGPAMIRAAAKNHAFVTIATDPADYGAIIEALEAHDGRIPLGLRRQLAAEAFARTAAYDAAIAGWFRTQDGIAATRHHAVAGRAAQALRYGENPHQTAALIVGGRPRPGIATARQLQGKQLSYNNLNDTDAAFELACEFDPAEHAAVVIVKHANPCGVALAATAGEAWKKALACDPVSAFGGIVALNRELDAETAALISAIFTEVIIAPSATDEALAIIAAKKNLRLLVTGALADPTQPGETARTVAGGMLVQSRDAGRVSAADLKMVTAAKPDARQLADMLFAFTVAKHVKSNAIVFVRDLATVGIGAGQMSRVDSARIAARKAADTAKAAGLDAPLTRGSVAASDAFFPFADGLEEIVAAGATAVIQPGGSMRDEEVIAAADAAGIAMAMTGMRHFRH